VKHSFRPTRVLGATVVLIAAIFIALFAVQDWWTHFKYIQMGWSVTSGQGWWRLTSGVAETLATAALIWLGVKLLGSKPLPRLARQTGLNAPLVL
jgi:hypothetical protein